MDDLREIANEKLRQNRGCRDDLLSLICSGEAIAFVGAGLSVPLRYPSWRDLLEKLHAQANQIAAFDPPEPVKRDVLRYAEAIKRHFEQSTDGIAQYRNTIGREFAPRQYAENYTKTHQRLAKLPFRAIITTNYDICIEQALQACAMHETGRVRPDPGVIIKASEVDRHIVSRFLRSISEQSKHQECYVAHLHGRWDDTQNIILTDTDYAMAYDGGSVGRGEGSGRAVTLHRQLAWSLFATRRMVFIGCSMDDPYIKRLLDTVAKDLWEMDQPIHFAMLPLDKSTVTSLCHQEATFLRYGLQVAYFDNLNETYCGLDQLLAEALERISKCGAGDPKSSQRISTEKIVKNEVSKISKSSSENSESEIAHAWLEEVNQNSVTILRKHEN